MVHLVYDASIEFDYYLLLIWNLRFGFFFFTFFECFFLLRLEHFVPHFSLRFCLGLPHFLHTLNLVLCLIALTSPPFRSCISANCFMWLSEASCTLPVVKASCNMSSSPSASSCFCNSECPFPAFKLSTQLNLSSVSFSVTKFNFLRL